MAAQLSLFKMRKEHGGELGKGVRKEARPLSVKRPMHITVRSSWAKGDLSFLRRRNALFIKGLMRSLTARRAVTVYEMANSGNHLHLLLRTRTKDDLHGFMRELTARLSRFVTGARRGRPFGKRFFDKLYYSRIVEWGKGYKAAKNYVVQNTLEALGIVPYTPRKSRRPLATPRAPP